jgi:Predicted membrane protein (DUF2306)
MSMSTTTSTAFLSNRLELNSLAETALKASARFWFGVALLGQFAFAFTVASFYGVTALHGNMYAWNKILSQGYVSGKTLTNSALIGHILFATVISIAGALQLIPHVRAHFPAFHRWNGRLYLLAAFTQGITGFYLTLAGKGLPGSTLLHIAIWISAGLIIFCAAMALRYALARDFRTHRRWALRLFLVASGSWTFRVGFSLTVLLFGPIGFDAPTFGGPLPVFWSFAEYLLPLAVLELYFFAQDRPTAMRGLATAGLLFILTLGMGAGIFAVAASQWIPTVRATYDGRKSIGDTLSATIASAGIDEAARQYHELKATQLAVYNFDERELNDLGYQLLRKNQFKEAIRVFQLNVEAYPQSSNVYDSLGEAYMDNGQNGKAITN